MTATHKTSLPKPTLRQRAEVAARGTAASAAEHTQDLSPLAMRKLILELGVQQIELELQNDELRRTQAERDMVQARYFDFYDLAPVGYFTVDLQGMILQANLTSASLLGVVRSKLQKRKIETFVHQEDQDNFYLMRQRASASKESQWSELRLLKPKANPVWVQVDAMAAVADDQTPILRLVMIDISVRKQMEAHLIQDKEKLKSILDGASDAFFINDKQGRLNYVNHQAVQMLGFSRDALLNMRVTDITPPGDFQLTQRMLAQLMTTGSVRYEPTLQRQDGSTLPTELNGVLLADGSGFAACRDITEQKRLQAAELTRALEGGLATSRQQLRELVALNEAEREEERKHIAREVHDELGQFLTALRMDLSLMTMRFGALDAALVTQVDTSKALVDRAIRSVRRVAGNLRPPELDLGLASALEFLCHEFRRQNAATCQLKLSDPYIATDDAHTVVIFRIVQESLTNVTRYAQATQVIVDLRCDGAQLGLEIRDNGCGFDMATVAARKTLGLLGMRERALALAGHLKVISAPGQGTVVAVTIPLDLNMNQPNP